MLKTIRGTLVLFLMPLTASPSIAQSEPLQSFSDLEHVTLHSLNVQLDPAEYKAALRGDLLPEAITVLLEGRESSVVGLQSALEGTWVVQLYFDQEILDTHTLRWAARLLAEFRQDLTALGPVEIVVADPSPRSLGQPSRDPEVLNQILSQLAIQGKGADNLTSLRRTRPAEESFLPTENESFVQAEEERILQQQLDRWLLHLNQHRRQGDPGVLFYISSGFDTNLDLFSGPFPFVTPSTPSAETLVAIAAYGWTVIPLLPEPTKPYLKSGFTLGSWRFLGFRGQSSGGAWVLSYEEDRDPERAEAFLALGEVHLANRDFESARDSLEQAIFHFGQDQKTAPREAKALVLLAQSLLGLNQEQRAWQAMEKAYAIEPSLVESYSPAGGDFGALSKALEQLATWTQGQVVRSRESFEQSLRDLQHQILVSYQGEGELRNEILETKVAIQEQPSANIGPSWSRSGIPIATAKARLRTLLEGGPESEDFGLRILLAEESELLVVETPQDSFQGTRWIRVTQAEGVDPQWQTIQAIAPVAWSSQEAQLRVPLPVASEGEESWRIILVEDIFSPEWAALFLD